MSVYTEHHQKLFIFQNHSLEATFYQPTQIEMKTVILYFHGGGFVFGDRDDLPEPYIDHLMNSGIGIVAVDYPLAPETKLPTILEVTNKITKWFVQEFLPAKKQSSYFIMGRSAGAFLALTNGVYTEQLSTRPLGIISLYGYYNLNDSSFNVPNRYYLKYPKVNEQVVSSLIQKEPLFKSANQNRFLVYLAARQKGDWMNLFLTSTQQKRVFSINHEKLKQLPPLFLASSTKDPDVPSRQSRQLANLHANASLHLVDIEEHDFDRTHIATLGIDIYQKMTTWILDLLNQ